MNALSETTRETAPGSGEGARPGAYRLPGAELVTQALAWAFLLFGVIVCAYVVLGPLTSTGWVALDRDAVINQMLAWLVPAAVGMALLRVLGLARVVDGLTLLPILLLVGVCLVPWVLAVPGFVVIMLLKALGTDAMGAQQPLIVVCQGLGTVWAVYVWYAARPWTPKPAQDGAVNPGAERPASPAS